MNSRELVAKYSNNISSPIPLDGLEDFDWSSVIHAHGPASDIPMLLRASLSKVDHDRQFAFALLHETIWHQGTVYEASSYVVPFLIKMIKSESTPDNIAVAHLIASLAAGHSCSKQIDYAEIIRNTIGKDICLLLPYLHSEIVWSISKAVVHYPEYVNILLYELHLVLESNRDLWHRECIENAIACLVEQHMSYS